MRYDWNLGHASMALYPRRKIKLVLIEYDGPQFAIFADQSKNMFVGLFAERFGSTERWLHAPLTKLELEALCTRGIAMRNTICKDGLHVIDYQNGREQRHWPIAPESVPIGILPTPGALLPKVIGDAALRRLKVKQRTNLVEPLFRLDGRAVQKNSVTFTGISVTTGALQKLWTAIGNAKLPPVEFSDEAMTARRNATTLMMAATPPGSFGITIDSADSAVFSTIANYYKSLLALTPDTNPAIFREIHTSVIDAYLEYLRTLETHGIEVLTNWSQEVAFIGYSTAAKMRPIFQKWKKPTKPDSSAETEITSTLNGYFDSIDLIQKDFTFYNLQVAQTLKGKIDSRLCSKMSEGATSVGRSIMYNIQIKSNGGKHVLLNLAHAQLAMLQ